MRALTPLIAWGLLPEDELNAATESLNSLVERLEPHARQSRYDGTNGLRLDGSSRSNADNASLWEGHCVMGASHPYAPPVTIETTPEQVTGHARWSAAYEGQKGFVHGGALASALDVVLGYAAARSGLPSVTGMMTLRFVRSVPIDRDVSLRASLVDVDGRKVRVRAEMVVDGDIAVEADAVFVTVTGDRFGVPD